MKMNFDKNGFIYLTYRKIKACSQRVLYYIFGLLPIKKNKVVFIADYGMQGFACNPKAIANEFIARNNLKNTNYELVWLVNKYNKEFPDEIKKYKNNFLNRAYHLSTSKVWIDTHRKHLETRKKRNQLYIQTWHGPIGFKAVGKMKNNDSFLKIAEMVNTYDSSIADYFISNSNWCSNVYRKGLDYSGDIIRVGSPRCDNIINNKGNKNSDIRSKLNIPEGVKILLYAPTFRGGDNSKNWEFSKIDNSIDFEKIVDCLEHTTNCKWYVLLRLHPVLADKLEGFNFNKKNFKDVSKIDDMYDILNITDMMISDYSSVVFDASYAKIPTFLYVEDIDDYTSKRGLLWGLDELPFPYAKDNDGLIDCIRNFDFEEYSKKLDLLFEEIELLEDGKASERVVDCIEYFVKNNKKNTDFKYLEKN